MASGPASEGLGDRLALLLALRETEALAELDGDALTLELTELLGLPPLLGEGLGLTLLDADRETLLLGLWLALGDADGLRLALGEEDGLTEGDGELEGDRLADGLTDGETLDEPRSANVTIAGGHSFE